MRIAFAGTPQVAVPALNALVESNHEVVGVLTRPDAPSGRGRRLHPSPVAIRAEELGIEIWKPRHPREPWVAEELRARGVEAAAVVAYGALLPQALLDLLPWVNLHFSVLPRWRGAAPVQRALWAGDQTTGATTFQIVKALDEGPIYRTLTTSIGDQDTAGDLLERLADLGAALLSDTMDDVAAGVSPTPQPTQAVTLAAKVSVEDAHIDWNQPAVEVSRQIRATTPDPGAWSLFAEQRFKVLQATIDADTEPPAPGVLRSSRRALWAGTADRPLRLDRVQGFGKKPMLGPDWARGVKIEGERLS